MLQEENIKLKEEIALLNKKNKKLSIYGYKAFTYLNSGNTKSETQQTPRDSNLNENYKKIESELKKIRQKIYKEPLSIKKEIDALKDHLNKQKSIKKMLLLNQRQRFKKEKEKKNQQTKLENKNFDLSKQIQTFERKLEELKTTW